MSARMSRGCFEDATRKLLLWNFSVSSVFHAVVAGRAACSFCPSVGNERVLWKNGQLNRDVVWSGGSGGSNKLYITWVQMPRGQHFGGYGAAQRNA